MTEIIIIITAATSDTISLEQALEKAKIRNYDKKGGYITKLRLLLYYMILFNRIDRLKFIDHILRWLLINK